MVEFQEEMKYGRSSGVDFGPVDFVKYAESFGAKGYRATSKEEFASLLQEALAQAVDGPVLLMFQSTIKIILNLAKLFCQMNFTKKRV